MHKTAKRICLITFLLLTLFLFISCGECDFHVDENKDGFCDECNELVKVEQPQIPQEPVVDDSLVLIEGGEAKFTIVLEKNSSSTIEKAVNKLLKTLYSLGISVEKLYDEPDNIKDTEVLVGTVTNRAEKYRFDKYSLGAKGYAIQIIDGKLLIVGGSDESLVKAIGIFEKDFLKISKNTEKLEEVSIKSEDSILVIQDDYNVTSLKICGNDIREYTISFDSTDKYASVAALELQNLIYLNTGCYLSASWLGESDKSISIKTLENSHFGDGFSVLVDDSGISFETEFPDKLKSKVISFFSDAFKEVKGELNFTSEHSFSENLRDIYYSDFGACADGITDDFSEIKACHDYANKWGHKVFADKNKTYYIGKEGNGESIIVKTDTDWQGAKFVFDDSDIHPTEESKIRRAPIFLIESDKPSIELTNKFLDKSLIKADTNVGFSLGYAVLLKIKNDNVKQYIRYGINQDDGYAQQEVLLVDADGNISSETPIIWDYDVITYAVAYPIDDRPISVGNASVTTVANRAPNYYTDYARNIQIRRSHTTLFGVDHSMINETETRAPYKGSIHAENCYDVTIRDVKVQHQENRYDADRGALLGTYELGADYAVEVRWINCYQKNFYDEDGKISYKGLFCTDFCRNLYLEGCFLNSFDSHKALDNLVIKNSTFEHINCIGTGDAVFENITVYADGTHGAAIKLRPDYGSFWNGNMYIDGLCIRYFDDSLELSLFRASYADYNFGYTGQFPKEIYVKDVTTEHVIPTNPSSDRFEYEEKVIARNKKALHLCTDLELYATVDISKFKHQGGFAYLGVYLGAHKFSVTECPGITGWILPNTPQFQSMQFFIDGEEIEDWKSKYGSK